jgi:AcrR family transcriptional regulator
MARCVGYSSQTGGPCQAWAIKGATVCAAHGGRAPLVRKAAQATSDALVGIARKLFATRGYSQTPIAEIVRHARVTRGALYHHFSGKQDLFRAVFEDVEQEIIAKVAAAAAAEPRPERHLEIGCQAFLDARRAPDARQIVLLDAPSVLGWETWHELDAKYGHALVATTLTSAMDAGYIERYPIQPLAHLILGALNEAALAIAKANDTNTARAEIGATITRLIKGLQPQTQPPTRG